MIELDTVLALLPEHIAQQRWYGGPVPVGTVRVVESERWLEGDPTLWWLLVDIEGAGHHQLLIGVRSESNDHDFLHGKHSELVGTVTGTGGPVTVYDAAIDAELARAMLHRVVPDVDVRNVRPITVEQSNTSVVYDEHVILKVFRRVHDGPNLDVDAVQRLGDAGFAHVPEQLGVLRRGTRDLAVARRFLSGATDGWHLALTSLRVLFADHLSAATSGGDFGPDAGRLGAITGEMHRLMADLYGTSPADGQQWTTQFHQQLDRVGDAVDVAGVRDRYEQLSRIDDFGVAIRVHGDLHLGQVLRADVGWYVIDFEGEPARPPSERALPSSPLRDVAGMLRSFHYAAQVACLERADEPGAAELSELADGWESRARSRFLAGYFEVDGIADLLVDQTVTEALLAAFEIDKAVYEVGYELAHRPDWVEIPRRALARLLT